MFLADVKGDLSGMISAGADSEDSQDGLYTSAPVKDGRKPWSEPWPQYPRHPVQALIPRKSLLSFENMLKSSVRVRLGPERTV